MSKGKGIDEIFEMLNYNNDIKIQKEGIKEAKRIKYLSILFRPIGKKKIWENCAMIIAEKTDKELKIYTHKLLEWLEDSNCPGYNIIYERIKKMPLKLIIYALSYYINIAKKDNNKQWLENLNSLIENETIYKALLQNNKIES